MKESKAMTKKAKRKARLLDLLNRELQDLHHNAELGWVKEWSDLPEALQEAIQEREAERYSWELQEINDTRYPSEGDYIEQRIARDYGEVCTYGRSGATCAPSAWVRTHGGSSFSIIEVDVEEITFGAVFALFRDVRDWNAYVKAECSAESRRENMADYIAEWLADREEEKRIYIARLLA